VIGGIGMFRRVAELCERRLVPVAAHAWSSGVGIMANYHAAFASPNCAMLELPNVPNPLRDELLTEPLRLVDGKILTPTAPGLGVTLPDDLEARYPYRPGTVYRVLGN
jgi:L-alanine-DL-glutamate epimerase-like enolase superfamily enzyme